ncbi:hypothetical protein P171DRAFT_424555 [Karstenula rhodostoma CBS 690.94]|uniref:Uncharacterized protein n=1 Tax=Karstenula rhodostoma CBS 690.94 TaxID=1392251 RepID=A0A9P4P796_9PLEO|nr:hypothetical protein P171DRAFT_424555 [Karstenula rhodostoma CBS 690.94]
MPSSTMWTTVLQTTALYTAFHILTHHASENIFRDVWENPAVKNFTAIAGNDTIASNATTSKSATTPTDSFSFEKDGAPIDRDTANRLIGEALEDIRKGSDEPVELPLKITLENGTVLNKTVSVPKAQQETKEQESFYTKKLPLDVVAMLIMGVLQYCWLLRLEHALPARSRRRDVVVKEKGEMDEDREEEVVKKWIAQGRVRRASLNWCNTLFKWILNLTVGRAVAYNCAGSFFHITPLAELIAFVAVPAYKQMVFVAGAELAFQVFLVTVVGKLAGWAVQTPFVQDIIRNTTQSVVDSREREEAYRMFKNEL